MKTLPLRRLIGSASAICTVAAAVLGSAAHADPDIVLPPEGKLAPPLKGEHVTMVFRQSDFDLLEDKKEFTHFYDQVYETMAELTANQPPMYIRGHYKLGAWGTAGMDGIRIEWDAVAEFMKDFNKHKVSFGAVHEIGHVFDARDFPRWYITPNAGGEMFANFKLSYTFDRLLTKDTPYVINFGPGGDQKGVEFNDNYFPPHGTQYLESDTTWDQMSVDALHAFHHQFVRKYGWDVYKKMFRAFIQIEKNKNDRAPGEPSHPTRIQVVCALLSKFSGENLVPVFQKWRMPVTDEDIETVTKRYKLDDVCAKVNADYTAEFAKGEIHLDPQSLRIIPMKAPNGKTGFTLANVFGDSKDVAIRYTIDGSDPSGASGKVYAGKPIAASVGTTVKAVLYVKGKEGPQTTATLEIPSDL